MRQGRGAEEQRSRGEIKRFYLIVNYIRLLIVYEEIIYSLSQIGEIRNIPNSELRTPNSELNLNQGVLH